jgi:transcriptional regulator with XRE-family HTH domain
MARTKAKQGPDPVDIIVGANVRRLRNQRGLSQSALAEALGMTFQQVQKYEKGTNRIASSNLVHIARTLGVVVSTLFAGVENGIDADDEFKGREMLAISTKGFQVGQLWDKCEEPVQRAALALLKVVNKNDPELAEEAESNDIGKRRKIA